jgi:hypothetical protein
MSKARHFPCPGGWPFKRLSSFSAVLGTEQGGSFLRKKPLDGCGSDSQQLESRYCGRNWLSNMIITREFDQHIERFWKNVLIFSILCLQKRWIGVKWPTH